LCSVLEAELWGIFNGLKLDWSRGFRKIYVFVDFVNAITLLKDGCITTNPQRTLVENSYQIHNNNGEVNWKHIFREINQVADDLVKHCLSLDNGIKIFKFSPSFISNVSLVDGVAFPISF